MTCDCCLTNDLPTLPYLMDENAEIYLCARCARSLRKECSLTLIDPDGDYAEDEGEGPIDTDFCPIHGWVGVLSYGATQGPDPYGVNNLACGHSVICLGPGEPNTIIRTRRIAEREMPTHRDDEGEGPVDDDRMPPGLEGRL